MVSDFMTIPMNSKSSFPPNMKFDLGDRTLRWIELKEHCNPHLNQLQLWQVYIKWPIQDGVSETDFIYKHVAWLSENAVERYRLCKNRYWKWYFFSNECTVAWHKWTCLRVIYGVSVPLRTIQRVLAAFSKVGRALLFSRSMYTSTQSIVTRRSIAKEYRKVKRKTLTNTIKRLPLLKVA